MGLDMVPIGKPTAGFEKRFAQIFRIVQGKEKPALSFLDKLRGIRLPTQEMLLEEWFDNQTPAYESIDAPMVGRDAEADEWIKARYEESDKKVGEAEFIRANNGYYVVELAKEADALPVYISMTREAHAFRGQFLSACEGVIDRELINEAWESKLAEEALDYGNRLMAAAEVTAQKHNLQYLKDERNIDDSFDETSVESQLHIVYSLAKWLIFYGKNGHGYEADF